MSDVNNDAPTAQNNIVSDPLPSDKDNDPPNTIPPNNNNEPADTLDQYTHTDQFPPSDVDIINSRFFLKGRKIKTFTLPDNVRVLRGVHRNKFIDYLLLNTTDSIDFDVFFDDVAPKIESILFYEISQKLSIKSNFFMVCVFVNSIQIKMEHSYKTHNSVINNITEIEEFYQNQFDNLRADFDNRDLANSGWSLYAIKYLELRVSKLVYIPGGSFIKLPDFIAKKRAVFNVKSIKDNCFKLCILSKYSKKIRTEQPKAVLKYEHLYNFNIEFPTPLSGVKLFCKLNPQVSINVFSILRSNVFPVYLTKTVKKEHFNLLYIVNNHTSHYALITNLSRLLSTSVSRHKGRKLFCLLCLLHFETESSLEVHSKYCGGDKMCKIKLPKKGTCFKFSKFDACQRADLTMTLDTESLLRPVSTCAPSNTASYTNAIQTHLPLSFGTCLVSRIPQAELPFLKLGCYAKICRSVDEFETKLIAYLNRVAAGARELFKRNYKIDMSPQDEQNFQESTSCYICNKKYTDLADRCRDHDHSLRSRNYRGSAHSKCNILTRRRCFIPVYVHNLSYDSKHLLRAFSKRKFKINIIPCTIEKVLTFSVHIKSVRFVFLDSFKIFGCSLDEIASALPADKFIQTKKFFDPSLHSFVIKKSPFPYAFLSDVSRLDHTTYPEKKWFTNDLKDEPISDSEYERGKLIWSLYKCKKFQDFVYFYQISDCTILMDCILNFRELFWDKFSIEVSSFLSMAHLALNAMLKITQIEIELISEEDQDILEIVQRSILGGLSQISQRFVEAGDDLELFFCDANSLYPLCMTFKMPIGEYKFVNTNLHDWRSIDPFSDYGYILECSISFPEECHEYLSCLPPIVERKKPPLCKTNRLISDFTPKINHVISLAHLQLVLELGGKLDNINRVVQFKQSSYMSTYVEIVSSWRAAAKTTYEKNLFKLALNSVYGKLLENVLGRKRVELVTCEKRLEKLVRSPTFKDRHIINYADHTMVLVESAKGVVLMDKPIIVGSQILSLSKVYMFRFWYNVLKPNFNHLKLILTDTDSFLFSCERRNFQEKLKSLSQYFDFSNLDPSHYLYSLENANKIGAFKDESKGKSILSVSCPKSKVYSIKYESQDVNKLKGIQRSFVKNKLCFEDYKSCVLTGSTSFASYKSIISHEQKLFTVEVNKLALSPNDLKRVILPCGILTLPYGDIRLNNIIA